MDMKKHLDILIHEDLRNTGFVFLLLKKARHLDLAGRVGYNSNGEVFIEVEGFSDQFELLVDYCKKNPNSGENTRIEILPGEVKNYYNFEMSVF
ncbi:MAG: hypothetical protein B6D61_04880 [Bacteroidetes bacterium 4484_249]|nr:MAG: hypothetical protein B6D61_04880 [Bacteroidetes bacterium 4484_249]OYT13253.1 MAG: hypothetical protein B6I19_06095 [Bacteroidetes bacterium 4572_114]